MSYLDDTGEGIRQEAGGILFYCYTAWPQRRQHCIAALVEEAAAYNKIHLFRRFISMNSAGAKLYMNTWSDFQLAGGILIFQWPKTTEGG